MCKHRRSLALVPFTFPFVLFVEHLICCYVTDLEKWGAMPLVLKSGGIRSPLPPFSDATGLSRLARVKERWCCVCDEMSVGVHTCTCNVNKMCANINLVNRYDFLQHECNGKCDKAPESVGPVCEVGQSIKNVAKTNQSWLRIGTWNFQGLCSERIVLELSEVASKNHIDILGGQGN